MSTRRRIFLSLAFLLVGACGTETARGTGFVGSVVVGDTLRTFILYVPVELANPAPLIMVYHGAGSSGSAMRFLGGFDLLADQQGMLVAYPDAAVGVFAEGCDCRSADSLGIDDLGFTAALIDSLTATFGVDRTRVYAAGLSQGGLFVHRLACEMTGRFAAVAGVAGPISVPMADACAPSAPIAVMEIMGTADASFPFVDGRSGDRAALGARATVERWRVLNGCTGDSTVAPVDDVAPDGTTSTVLAWSPCTGGSSVSLVTVVGGVHEWEMSGDFSTALVLTDFFLRHHR